MLCERIEADLKGTAHGALVEDLFQGEQRDYVRCHTCGTVSHRTDRFQDLKLAVPHDEPGAASTGTGGPDGAAAADGGGGGAVPPGGTSCTANVREALRQLLTPEQLRGSEMYQCDCCGCKTDAERGVQLTRLPPILTLQLKRFRQDDASNTRTKNSTAFDFPLYLDMAPYVAEGACPLSLAYELSAVIVHQGSADEGHYYALVKDEASAWRKYDDATVTKMKGSELRRAVGGAEGDGPTAYMLLYRQVSDPQLIPQALAHSDSRVMASAGASIPEALATSTSVLVANWENEYASAERNDDDADDDDDDDDDDAVEGDDEDVDDREDILGDDEEDEEVAAEEGTPGGAAYETPQSRAEAIYRAARSYGRLPPTAQATVLRIRNHLLNTFALEKTSWDFLRLHNENPPAPGEAAMLIEAAHHALPPVLFVEFARQNAHWYTSALLRTIFERGYWPLAATRAVVASIKALRPEGGLVAYCGACDGSGIEFGPGYQVVLYDPVPMAQHVAPSFYPSHEVDALGLSCALAPPAWMPEQLTGLLTKVRADGGVLVLGDYLGRGQSMGIAAKLLEHLANTGAGIFERRSRAGYHRKRQVDLLIFTRRPGQSFLLPTEPPAPRQIALFAAMPTPPPPRLAPGAPHRPMWPRALSTRRPRQQEVHL